MNPTDSSIACDVQTTAPSPRDAALMWCAILRLRADLMHDTLRKAKYGHETTLTSTFTSGDEFVDAIRKAVAHPQPAPSSSTAHFTPLRRTVDSVPSAKRRRD
jgi:hypothetical protein